MEFFPSLSPLLAAKKPRALLVDLWGVIHDGEALYPGVKEALAEIKNQGVKIIFLSNAPRRASAAEKNLSRLGIAPELYDGIVTSGEAVYAFFVRSKAPTYYYIGPQKDRNLLEGLPCYEVQNPEEAAFAVCTGLDQDDSTLEEKLPQLKAALAAKLPLICANPDMEIVRLNGARPLCAGVLAEWYEKQGGDASYFGKPWPEVYAMALAACSLPPEAVIAIGDNLDTDIKGANKAGIRSALVTGGVLKEALGEKRNDTKEIAALSQLHGAMPDIVLPGFSW